MPCSPSDPIELVQYRPWQRIAGFLIGFTIAATAGLSYVYTRPAEYRATSRIQISPARAMTEDQTGAPGLRDQTSPILTEAQALTSRAVLQDAIDRLNRAGAMPDLGRDPVGAAQHLLQARTVDGTPVVELVAEGRGPLFPERLVNMVVEAYRDHTTQRYEQQISREYQELQTRVQNLHDRTLAAGAQLDAVQEAYRAVSANKDKLLTDVQNVKRVYTASTKDFLNSRAYLQTLNKQIDAGLGAGDEKNDPAIPGRGSTPVEPALHPETPLPGQLADIDRQIAEQRWNSQVDMILAATQQLQANRARLDRLHGVFAEKQKEAGETAARLAEYGFLQDQLAQAQQDEKRAVERLTNLPASQRDRAPVLRILQPGLSGASPIRPDYTVNAWITIAASFGLGFIAARLAGFFAGRPAVAFWDPPQHMQSWDGAPALTFRPLTSQYFNPASVKLLPAPDPP